MCIKRVDNPGLKNIKGDNSNEIIICAGRGILKLDSNFLFTIKQQNDIAFLIP